MATTDKDKKTYSWGTPNFFEELATFNEQKKQEQAKKVAALKKKVSEEGDRELAKTTRNYTTTSNATTSVARGRLQNKHLEERGLQGAALHAAWEKEHPNLAAWSLTAAAIPFAVAVYPFIAGGATAAADAAAATTTGLAITSGLNFAANAVKANPYVAKALPWINAGLTSLFAGHGASEVSQGRFTPMTALELAPLGLTTRPAWNFTRGFMSRTPIQKIESLIVKSVSPDGKIRLSLPSHTLDRPRLLVLEPLGNNKYYIHTRTWDGDHIPANMSASEKQALYDALYEELPEGAEILFPLSSSEYLATRGTVAGLLRLARDSRFTPGTRGTLLYLDKDGKTIQTYEGTSFIKTPRKQTVPTIKPSDIPESSAEKEYVDALLNGTKPMFVLPIKGAGANADRLYIDRLLRNNYRTFDLNRTIAGGTPQTLRYYINEDKFKLTIDTYKKLYQSRLGLSPNSTTDDIFNHLMNNPELLNIASTPGSPGLLDIIGLSLGYGIKDAILFKLGANGLYIGDIIPLHFLLSLKTYEYDKLVPGIYDILKKNIERGTLVGKHAKHNGSHVGFGYSRPQITAENAASITPEQWTAAQDAAIARGDMTEAQRLSDLHASVNGYNPSLSLYHGSPETFNEFEATPNFSGYVDYHSHFGTNPTTASKFGDVRLFYTNVKAPLRVTDQGVVWDPLNLARELGVQPKGGRHPLEPYWREFRDKGRSMYKEANRKFMEEELGGDAYIYDNVVEGGGDSYAIPTSRQVKLSDAVTYDPVTGKRIPLGERHNPNIDDVRYFKDDYGNEVIPTPYPGSDEALLSNIKKATEAVADHYFTDPQKIQLVKQTMGWGDTEYNELLEELSRILRYGEGEVKGVNDGFKSIAEAGIRGFLGEDASMVYPNNIITLNRDRLPNDNRALEAAVHELGGHAKTLHIDPNRNGGMWDRLKLMYPRVAELMEKNKEIADATLLLNEKGRFYALFPNSSDLEIFLEEHPEYKSMTEKLFNMRRRFKYITGDTLERTARGYTQLLMDRLGKPSNLGMTEFYTQPSVNEFSKRVLSIAAPITFTVPFLNNNK